MTDYLWEMLKLQPLMILAIAMGVILMWAITPGVIYAVAWAIGTYIGLIIVCTGIYIKMR